MLDESVARSHSRIFNLFIVVSKQTRRIHARTKAHCRKTGGRISHFPQWRQELPLAQVQCYNWIAYICPVWELHCPLTGQNRLSFRETRGIRAGSTPPSPFSQWPTCQQTTAGDPVAMPYMASPKGQPLGCRLTNNLKGTVHPKREFKHKTISTIFF